MGANLFEIKSSHPILSTSTEVAAICKPLEKLAISYFTYTRIHRSGKRIYLTNQPSVLESYLNGKHYLTGNVEGYPDHYTQKIMLWDSLPNQKIFDDVVRSYNFNHGIFIIEPHENHCDFYGLATNNGNSHIINTYLTKLDFIKNFTQYFTEKAKGLVELVSDTEIILPFNDDLKVVDFSIDDYDSDPGSISSADKKINQNRIKLTNRQIDCARLLLGGLQYNEIASQLKLSTRSIEYYIENMKAKLGCRNKSELIIKLTQLIRI